MSVTNPTTPPDALHLTIARRIASTICRAALVAAVLAILPSSSAVAAVAQKDQGRKNMKSIRFMKRDIKMAGNLYFPDGFKESGKYPAIVVVHPGGGVKEQTAGLYAEKMAEQGFVTLAFDAAYQGESGGEPRLLEDPTSRVEDVSSAVDYLTTLGYVDANHIGALGICAGSGYTIKASTLDRRIKTVATISAVDTGAAARKGWTGTAPVSEQIATLEAVAVERTAEAHGAKPKYAEYVPEVVDSTTHRDMKEAHDYYRKPPYMKSSAPNKMLFTSLGRMLAFTGFDQVDTLLTQPLLIIAGSEAGSLWHSKELYAKAKTDKKELFIIEGATHMDLYVGPHVAQALQKLAPFFKQNLGS
jgi:fermentation-respiration switch protein FrsA (DUF1100 family)